MNKQELLRLSWENLWRMKFRTILTIVGVVIGTASIIVMVSIGTGAQQSITGEFEGMGAITTLSVYPDMNAMNMGTATEKVDRNKEILNDDAIRKIKRFDNVVAVSPLVSMSGSGEIKVNRETYRVSISGVDYTALKDMNYKLSEGREPGQNDETGVLLGKEILTKYSYNTGLTVTAEKGSVKPEDLVGKTITMVLKRTNAEGEEETFSQKLKVAGVLEATGGNEDYTIVANMKLVNNMNEWITGRKENIKKEGYSTVQVIVEDAESVTGVIEKIQEMEFTVYSMQQILESMDSVFGVLQVLLGGIGGIALLVACIGIVNTMTMSIYERTKEIGIMKVIGASITDIRNMFIAESTMIGLIGGIVGIVISLLLSLLINFIAGLFLGGDATVDISIITLGLVLFSLVFSALVGMLSGVRPAIKAANLSSLDAIRSE